MSTRDKLLSAAADTVRDDGITGLSARAIAKRAGVNQALIFYHFGTVDDLVDAACRQAADASIDYYRSEFSRVASLPELLKLGRQLHERESDAGNVAMMAQLMAGAQRNAILAGTVRYAMSLWAAEIETVIVRVLEGSVLSEIADAAGLSRAVSAAFIGLDLYDGVDVDGAAAALGALERLGVLIDVVADLGPVARKALRARVGKNVRRRKESRESGRLPRR